MRKLIFNLMIIVLGGVLLQSCEKDVIIDVGFGTPTYVINKYILTDMEAKIFPNDTCKYSDVEIKLYFKGLLVGEDVGHSELLGIDPTVVEAPYFINVIKDIKAYCNNPSYKCYFGIYDYKSNTYSLLDGFVGEELGYSPMSLSLSCFSGSCPPDSSDYYSFTVKITDIYNNEFVATTDSIYITK
ncbi:MAG TPA: hypothetical protein PLK25_04070 [Bacteroidales bacterium]|nr:hypothetical protein [Patescibacteria group bacterium]HOF06416.1 hypothetical protein [Bacteroidales bacterium]HON96668.1 hypothetical protein [Bacteroidales bacterium]HOS19610.1 hypothetical protein [Bacteroidales bacterium]HOV55356.1 hypothetical protein [Bacteroidales bacterium]